MNKTSYSKDIIKHLADLNIEEGSEVLAAKLATGRYDYAIQISKKASYEKIYNKYNYPIITTPRVLNGKNMLTTRNNFGNRSSRK